MGLSGCLWWGGDAIPAAPGPAGITVKSTGLTNFGNVNLGDYRETQIKFINNDSTDIAGAMAPAISLPFLITKTTAECGSGILLLELVVRLL